MEKKYKRYGKGPIEYANLGEENETYKKLDRCMKDFKNYLEHHIIGQQRKKRPKPIQK